MNKSFKFIVDCITHESTVLIVFMIIAAGVLIGVTNLTDAAPIIRFDRYVNFIVIISPIIFMVWLALKNKIDDDN